MTGDFSKISKNTQASFGKKVQQNVPKNVAKLAKEMMIFADNNKSAISQSQFQTRLAQMESLNTKDLIKFIRSFDKDESIIELICDEIGDDKKTRKDACLRVLNALVNSAKDVDLSDLKKQFEDELNSQFRFFGKYINTEKLDNIINAITQAVEDRQNFTKEEWQNLQNTSSAEGQKKANEVLVERLEKAYSAFGERVGEDGEMTNVKKVLVNKKTGEKTEVKYEDGQMQRDGIAADIADGVSRIWGSENTADKVRKDLKIANAQLQELEKAQLEGEEAYKAKFKEIFGVEYDYTKHLSFQKNQEVYLKAAPKHELEMTFNRTFKTLLSNAPLRDEKEFVSADPSTNVMIETVTATKATVFKREYNNLVELMGENGEAILAELFEKNGVSNASIEDKFEVMKSFAKKWSNALHKETLEAGGGKSFSEIQAKYDNSYKAAYGVENDIMKRVNDYNTSQEIGGQAVKAGTVIVASMVAACSGMGLVGVAGVTSGATIVSEVVDRGTTGKALNALKEEGFTAYVKTANDDIDWEATLKQAVISGGSVLIGGAVAKGVTFVMQGQTPIAQAVAMFGADVLTDTALEYVTTGTITIEGVAFAVALSAVGNIIAYKQLSAAADVANSVDEAIDGAIAQPKVDAKTKLANAGFTDDVIANLKAQSDYGPELVDEVLDMIVYLEDQVAAGKPITKELIEGAIELYSPGASGGSASTQRTMIANTWNRGDEVFNAYGQKAPGQSTFSTGNMKAKYNKIKNGINDYIDYKKWEWGLDNPTAKTSAIDTSNPPKDFATKLADAKGLDGKPLFKQKDIDLILQGMADLDGKPIPNFEAKVEAVLKNFAEVDHIANSKNKAATLWHAISDPTQSTIDLNPAAFGAKPRTTAAPDVEGLLSRASGYVDDVNRLAFEMEDLIPEMRQYRLEIEDYARQATALKFEGDLEGATRMATKAIEVGQKASQFADLANSSPQTLLKPQVADNVKGQGISFKQAADQPDYSATRVEWGKTIEETIALNKKNGINLELVKGDDGQYFLGIKDIWTDGYHRVDRNSVVMHYGNYEPTPENYVAANPKWAKANANPDGTVKDCAVVANDTGAKILENSYVTADGQKIDFATMQPGTNVHKDPNAIVNAVAYDSPQTLHTLEGDITTDITMGDVDGNVYNNFKELKKQITRGQLVPNEADPNSARFIELVKAGDDDGAIALLKKATAASSKANAIEMSVADRLASEGVPLSISEKYSKAMDHISPFIEGNQDELAKFAKKYLANPEGFEKALKDIDMRAKEVDFRRQTYQHYGLARDEGYYAYERMHKEIERLTKLIDSILE